MVQERDEELLRKWWDFHTTPAPYKGKSHQGWEGDFLEISWSSCSISGERWTLLCILLPSSAFWLCLGLQPAKGTFPFRFPSLLYLRGWEFHSKDFTADLHSRKTFVVIHKSTHYNRIYLRFLKLPYIRGRHGHRREVISTEITKTARVGSTQELLVERNIQQLWLSKWK